MTPVMGGERGLVAAGGQVPGPRTESVRNRCLLNRMLLTEKQAELPNWRRVNDSNTGPPSPRGSQSWPPPVSSNLVFNPNVPYKYFHFLCDL